jgi:intracellular sulfur oxidation DsrE/DsrF family protein
MEEKIIMKTTIFKTLFTCLALSLCFTGYALAGDTYGKQKVVYHINYDNPQAQAGALRNIQNHINAVGAENVEVRIVMHGKGLTLLLEPDAAKNTKFPAGNATQEMQVKISSLKDQGVAFKVCANTLKGKNVDYTTDLYDVGKNDIVPSGVAELAHLQGGGFTYIKP